MLILKVMVEYTSTSDTSEVAIVAELNTKDTFVSRSSTSAVVVGLRNSQGCFFGAILDAEHAWYRVNDGDRRC